MALRGCRWIVLSFVCAAIPLFVSQSGAAGPATSDPPISPLTLSQVVDRLVEKNAARAVALERYTNRRLYVLDYKGFPTGLHAEMVVDMDFNAPATKRFTVVSEKGSKYLMNLIFKKLMESEQEAQSNENRDHVILTTQNYDFASMEYQPAADNCSYVLTVQPKSPSKFLFRGRVWVDAKDFAVCRIEAEPAKNPSFWIRKTEIHHSYSKVGDFWLPAQNESISTMRFAGRATLTIQYLKYEIVAAHSVGQPASGVGSTNTPDSRH